MYRIGLSTCGRKPVDAVSLRAMKRAGIDVIEICMEADRSVDFRRIRADADAVGIGLWSVHSHMRADFDISSLDRESNRRALRELGWLTDTVSEVGIDKLVIHPTHTPEPFDQTERREKLYHGSPSAKAE